MKLKFILILSFLLCVFFFIELQNNIHERDCNTQSKTVPKCVSSIQKIESIASKSLTFSDRLELASRMQKGEVKKTILKKDIATLINEKYEGQKVYAVIYISKRQSLLGDITIYIDPKTLKVIGRGIRE